MSEAPPFRTLALGALAGHAAHELNNLLTAMLGYGELLLVDLPEGARSREDAAKVVLAAQRARELTVQVLGLPRTSEELCRVNLSIELEGAATVLRAARPASVELEVEAEIGEVTRGPLIARLRPAHLRDALLFAGATLLAVLRDGGGRLSLRLAAAPGASGASVTLSHAGEGPVPAHVEQDLREARIALAALAAEAGGTCEAHGTARSGRIELLLPLPRG